MKPILAALAVLLPAALAAQDAPAPAWAWELAQPNAKLLFGADIKTLKALPSLAAFRSQIESQIASAKAAAPITPASPPPPNLVAAAMNMHLPGVELLGDIDRVFISSAEIKTPGSKQNPPYLVILEGAFPPAHYKDLLHGERRTYRTVPVYRVTKIPTPTSVYIALVDEHTLLLGDERSVFSALDRRGRALPLTGVNPNPLLARAAQLAPLHEIWLVIGDLKSVMPPVPGAAPGGMDAMASEVESIEVALSGRKGFTMDASLATKTPATAQMFAAIIQGQMQAQIAQLNDPRAAELARKLQMSANGNHFEMHVALTQEEVMEQIKLAQEARLRRPAPVAFGATAPLGATAPRTVEPPKPAGPRKIKIYGLDDGVKEINLDHP